MGFDLSPNRANVHLKLQEKKRAQKDLMSAGIISVCNDTGSQNVSAFIYTDVKAHNIDGLIFL